jgi:uncharacterized phage protein (TIGR01671 family)
MREIKFRAWHNVQNKMLSDEEINQFWLNVFKYNGDEEGCTFMQYTGFKDKNDQEIYEGDIVYFNDFSYDRTGGHVGDNILNGKVYFDSGMWLIETAKGHYSLCDSILNDEELEIVGNIYQNKELLK